MTTTSACQFRIADSRDVDAAVPLIYSSEPQAFDYGFQRCGKSSHDFLRFAFVDGNGFLGYKNHTVATLDGQVAGILAVYNLSSYVRLTLGHVTISAIASWQPGLIAVHPLPSAQTPWA